MQKGQEVKKSGRSKLLVHSPAKQNRTLVRRPIQVGWVAGSTLDWLGLGQQALGVPFQQLLQVDGLVWVAAVAAEQATHEPGQVAIK